MKKEELNNLVAGSHVIVAGRQFLRLDNRSFADIDTGKMYGEKYISSLGVVRLYITPCNDGGAPTAEMCASERAA